MKPILRSPKSVDLVLVIAIVVDVVLVAWTALDPGWWFQRLHGVETVDMFAQGLLFRVAAHWAVFAVFQIAALMSWRRWTGWLLIIAGVRFSDVFTDWSYLALGPDAVDALATLGSFSPER